MAGKFMRIKKIIIPVMAMVILTSQLTGCASVPSNVMLDMLNQGQDIEITMAVPDYEVNTIGDFQALEDVQLDQLQTYSDLRADFDSIFQIDAITGHEDTSKLGCIFIDKDNEPNGNTSLMDSVRNQAFMENHFNKPEVKEGLSMLGVMAYLDVEEGTEDAIYASMNAYYNLFSDGKEGNSTYFNPSQSVTRGDFYSFMYRATNGVNNQLTVQGNFKEQVGTQDKNALYASQVDQYAWLNADNAGLRKGNYDGSISRVEAVYMLMNTYFKAEMEAMDVTKIALSDAKDGGELLEDNIESEKESDQLYSLDKKSQLKSMATGWQLGVISKMLKSPELGVRTELYQALGLANELGIIESETRYDEPVSKSEAIDLFIKTCEALNKQNGYQSTAGDKVIENVTTDFEGNTSGTIDGEAFANDKTSSNDFSAEDMQYIIGKLTGASDEQLLEIIGKDYKPSEAVLEEIANQTPKAPPTQPTQPTTPTQPNKPTTPPSKPTTPPSKPTTPPKTDNNNGGGGNVWTPPEGYVPDGAEAGETDRGTGSTTVTDEDRDVIFE